MPDIVINGQLISFPDDAASPDWAPPIISFAQAVAGALAININAFDVQPQTFTLDSYNSASNIGVPALSFPISAVRAVFIRYSVYRTTSSANGYEAGDIVAVYNPNNASTHKWALTQVRDVDGGAQLVFNMTDSGQLQFTTTAFSGSGHTGKISFDARALAQ